MASGNHNRAEMMEKDVQCARFVGYTPRVTERECGAHTVGTCRVEVLPEVGCHGTGGWSQLFAGFITKFLNDYFSSIWTAQIGVVSSNRVIETNQTY